MQKLSEKLAGVEVVYVGANSICISLELWLEILTRTASYEREIEGEKDMQRRMGLESTELRKALKYLADLPLKGTTKNKYGETICHARHIAREALKIKR